MSQLSSASRLAATLLLLAAAAAGSVLPSPLAEVPACQNHIDALQTTCLQFVKKDGPKVQPSPDCCATVKALADADVPCVCDYLGSPAAREKISLEKVFYVTKQCGVTIPGTCGALPEGPGLEGFQPCLGIWQQRLHVLHHVSLLCHSEQLSKYTSLSEFLAPWHVQRNGTDMPCVCNYMGFPRVRDNISLEKVFYVTKQCGITIPRSYVGSKQL
ncbi:non-specific lipid transfer protein GPI-anchored 24-like [Phragmites australis]|uniref:non-specific lipid transfer protein GPI-anchored 24-like n=1 Tax=Phragmites australis TaxID=29695 RepID=UPI002D76AB70|nr:non-specific lipid transfer protein GPI-anchored 24-like [Phragmites australis]